MSIRDSHISSRSKGRKPALKISLLILGILSFACVAGFFILSIVSLNAYEDGPKMVEGANVTSEFVDSYSLSQDQVDILGTYDYPDSFSIFFYVEEFDPFYDGEVREESWRYYEEGVEFTFYNGALIAEDSFILSTGELVPNLYQPEQFTAYAPKESVLASGEIHDTIEIPLEKTLIPGGKLYYAPGLTFGILDDRLIYVETITLEVEGEPNG